MKESAKKVFEVESVRLEGYVPFMYLDVKGLVTTGIGNLIDPMPLGGNLPWRRKTTKELATQSEYSSEWQLIKNTTTLAKHGHRAASGLTKLYLEKEDVYTLVAQVRDRFYGILKVRFPEIDSWPADAQLATMSMAWACGPWFRFANLEAALRAKNFRGAAASCAINTTGNPGVRPRNVMNTSLYITAQLCQDGKLNGDIVHWGADRSPKGLQGALNASGTNPKLVVDGVIGPKTRAATAQFQSSNGLVSDGVAGPLTWGYLEEVLQSGGS